MIKLTRVKNRIGGTIWQLDNSVRHVIWIPSDMNEYVYPIVDSIKDKVIQVVPE